MNPAETALPVSRMPTWRCRFVWLIVATASFHLAYLFPPCAFMIGVYVFALFQLSAQPTRFQAMNTGWLLAFLVYGPHLAFFWKIFGAAAIALWLVLGFWLGLFLALLRFVREKWGTTVAACIAPILWTGLEYFRSELYFLRFSWLNVGYAFSWTKSLPAFAWLGVYGIGFVLMCATAAISMLPVRRRWITGVSGLAGMAVLFNLAPHGRRSSNGRDLKVAGLQLEFQMELEIPELLDRLYTTYPDADLYVLPEYTFQETVPKRVKDWCRRHQKFLLAGGKEPITGDQFYNMAYVIGTNGDVVFKQAKAQPIQFFKDGLPAPQQQVWNSPWGKLGICICYDLSYTRLVDALARQGAQALLVPTMDVEEWGEYQHHLHARVGPMRAAEYRIPIFRVASSGLSQIITGSGESVQTKLFPGSGEMLAGTLRLADPARLPLDRWLVWPAVVITGVLAAWAFWLALFEKKHLQPAPSDSATATGRG